MKTIKIEKFINGQHEKTTHVPVALLDVLSFILPRSGVSELLKHGIDLSALQLACKEETPYSKTIEVEEGSVLKKVVISVE
jgi:hypothetical protein